MSVYQTIYDALRCSGGAPQETILLLQSRAAGRRLLAALAAHCGPVLGVRAETPWSLALELAGPRLAAEDAPRLINDDEAATLLLGCIPAEDGPTFTQRSAGTLAAARELYRTLTELAMEEIGPLAGTKKLDDLQALRAAYAAAKRKKGLWDRADLFAYAAADAPAPARRTRVTALPAQRFSALEAQVIRKIAGAAPEVLPVPVPAGAALPGADLTGLPAADPFAGRSGRDTRIANCMGTHVEVDFVLRDILERGYPLDSCAVVCCSGSYAPLLYEAAGRCGMPVSMSAGVPFEQSRLSAALKILSDLHRRFFDAEQLRALLTRCGCLASARPYLADKDPAAAAALRSAGAGHLAKMLRDYRVGWGGREKYLRTIEAFRTSLDAMKDQTAAEAYRLQSAIWRDWLNDLFLLTDESGHTVAEQRAAMLRFLSSAAKSGGDWAAVATAIDVARHIPDEIPRGERLLDWLRRLLRERPILAENAAPGKLFCLPLRQGYLACREHVYVLGLGHDVFTDARESAVLLDAERAALSPRLVLGRDAGKEKRFRFLQLLLHQDGELILCWPGYDCERQTKLECARELEALTALPDPAQVTEHWYVPDAARTACDALLTEERSEIAPLPAPDPGDAAPAALQAAPAFADWMAGREFSASAIETALECPFKFYLTYALGIREESLPVWSAERWLEPNIRGTLVHAVLEGYYKALKQDPNLSAADRAALEARLFDAAWVECLLHNPPPVDKKTEAAEQQLQRDMVHAAIVWTDAAGRTVTETEQRFDGKTVTLKQGEHEVKLKGTIDRLDACPDGSWAILDYKTGDPERHERYANYHIQHYLYAEAERILSGGAVTPAEAGYLLLGGIAKGGTEAVYFPADAAARADTEKAVTALLDAITDEEICRKAKPWAVADGALWRVPEQTQKNMVKECEKYCVFRELCPLRTGEQPPEPEDDGIADATDDTDDTDNTDGKGGTGNDSADE